MMEASARQNILHSIIYKQKKRFPLLGQNRRKSIHQAVSASLPTGNSARTAYLHCFKDGANIDPCCGTGGFFVAAMHRMLEKAENDIQKKNVYFSILPG
jgi:tRNA G10  N-methylase Trm11